MSSSSRSSRISALSDKIQGLKFMQRASASASTSSSSSSSTSTTTSIAQDTNKSGNTTITNGKDRTSKSKIVSPSSQQKSDLGEKSESKVEDNTDKNDEHWSLPTQIKRVPKKPSISRIEAQVGWNDWLDQFQNDQRSSKSEKNQEPTLPSARKSFGSWAKDSKQKSKEKDVREEDEEDYEGSINGSSKDESFKKQGFIKPGTISNSQSPTKKQTNKKRKSDEHEDDDNDEILLDIRKDKKKKKKKETSKNEDNHSQARKESAIKKRKDMASNGKATKRKKEGFLVPDLNKEGDSEEFDSSDIEATLGGFHE